MSVRFQRRRGSGGGFGIGKMLGNGGNGGRGGRKEKIDGGGGVGSPGKGGDGILGMPKPKAFGSKIWLIPWMTTILSV